MERNDEHDLADQCPRAVIVFRDRLHQSLNRTLITVLQAAAERVLIVNSHRTTVASA